MKKILIVLISGILGLSGCKTLEKNNQKTFNLVGENKKTIAILSTTDNWESAALTENGGKKYELTRAVSGSGIMLQDNQDNNLHFKGKEGILILNGKKQKFQMEE